MMVGLMQVSDFRVGKGQRFGIFLLKGVKVIQVCCFRLVLKDVSHCRSLLDVLSVLIVTADPVEALLRWNIKVPTLDSYQKH